MGRKYSKINDRLKIGMTLSGVLLVMLLIWKSAAGVYIREAGFGLLVQMEKKMPAFAGMVWKQSYPAIGMKIDSSLENEEGSSLSRLAAWVLNSQPIYRQAVSGREEEADRLEEDPSYERYLEKNKFYQEHEYLFQYGTEDTNQQELAEALPADPPPVDAGNQEALSLTETAMTPAYTVLADLPVIGQQYVKEQLADYDFLMKHFYNVHSSTTAGRDMMDVEKFLSEDFSIQGSSETPQILIYHTHSQETFADYGADNSDATVVGMGNYLTELLQAKGYHVIHDTSVYDLKDGKLDRNKAYTYALEGITGILQKNPSIEVILDLHRDGVNPDLHMVSEVNGKPTAPIMFFNGTSQTPSGPIEYLQNPYREDNLAFSLQMQLDAAAYFPGLTRKIYLKGLRYNLHLRPKSALVEVGAQTNTYQEARNAMEPLSELLDMILQGK